MADITNSNKIIDIRRAVLFTDGVDGKKARFQFSVREGYPRLTVFTGARGRDGIISGPMDIDGFLVFTKSLQDIANGKPGDKMAVDLKTMLYENNQPTDKTQLMSTLFFGKDDDGMVWLGLQTEGKPKLKFIFKVSDYMLFRKADGTTPLPSEMSSIIASSYASMLEHIFAYYSLNYSIQHQNTFNTAQAAVVPGGMVSSTELDDLTF